MTVDNGRVLHIIHAFGMGGAETWLIELLRYVKKSQKDDFPKFDFIITSGQCSILDDVAKKLGARLYYIPLKKGTTLDFIRSFRNLLKKNNYLAIHDHQDFLSGWHFLFGIFYLPKVRITHVHNPSYQIFNNYGVTFFRRLKIRLGAFLVYLFSTDIKGTSYQLLEEYSFTSKRFLNKSPSSLHCSFELNSFRNNTLNPNIFRELKLEEDDKIILFVGRLDYSLEINNRQNHKNSAFALHVMAKLPDNNTKLLFVGKNEHIKKEFIELANKLNVFDRIRLLGIRNDVSELMSISDLLFFPSRAEGLGMVVVEAQASGLKVLSSDSVPIESVVIDNLVSRISLKSNMETWVETIQKIIKYPYNKNEFYHDNRWVKSDFNIENSIHKLKNLYYNNES